MKRGHVRGVSGVRACKLLCWAAVRANGAQGAFCPACDETQRALDLMQNAAGGAVACLAPAAPLVLAAPTGNDAALLAISNPEDFK